MNPCLAFLICPLCQTTFRQQSRVLRCEQGHAFDLAREGYANLLINRGKRPKFLGDSKEMLRARRQFFDAGFYAPLAERVRALAQEVIETAVSSPVVIDIGCSEGYYLGHVAQNQPSACFFGVDIAKEATRLAAKRYKQVQFVVADSKRPMPFRPAAATLLLNIFAPRNPAEFGRLLGENGRLLIVIPTEAHLAGLRERLGLLNIETDKEARINQQLAPWFQPIGQETLNFKLNLAGDTLQQIVLMSPSARHLGEEQKATLAALTAFEAQTSFRLLLFQKKNRYLES